MWFQNWNIFIFWKDPSVRPICRNIIWVLLYNKERIITKYTQGLHCILTMQHYFHMTSIVYSFYLFSCVVAAEAKALVCEDPGRPVHQIILRSDQEDNSTVRYSYELKITLHVLEVTNLRKYIIFWWTGCNTIGACSWLYTLKIKALVKKLCETLYCFCFLFSTGSRINISQSQT